VRNPPKLALWDIDGTLATPSLERQFVDFLMRTGRSSAARIVARALLLACRWPPSMYRMKLPYVRSEPTERVTEWVELWWSDRGERSLLPGASRTLHMMRERGVELVLLSGTADFLAARVARHFGVSQFIAGRAEILAGRYTGALVAPPPHGRYKLDYAEAWMGDRQSLWHQTCALGDHEGDVPLLARAGLPVAVNPRPRLQLEAVRRGWPVVTDDMLPAALLDNL